MWKKFLVLISVIFFLSGCAATLRGLEYGKEGYDTPVAAATRTAVEAAGTPFVGTPLAQIAGGIISMIVGGLAVWKRQRWLDTPTNK